MKKAIRVAVYLLILIFSAGVAEVWGIEKIFFHSTRAGVPGPNNAHIWMMNPDGSGLEQVTFGDVRDYIPVLSPDGTKLTITRAHKPECYSIWVRDLISGAETPIDVSNDCSYTSFYSFWSPDGEKIGYNRSTNQPGSSRIWAVDVDFNSTPPRSEFLTKLAGTQEPPGYGSLGRQTATTFSMGMKSVVTTHLQFIKLMSRLVARQK